jgi:uncharacterized protein involved in exopolysaccharide biosynthesis
MAQEMISTRNQSLQPLDSPGAYFPVRLQGETSGSSTVKQLFMVIFKWKRLILMMFIAFSVAAGVAMYLKPPVRTATAKILLKPDRVSLQISGYGGSVAGKLPYPPQVMQSEVELIKSREVLLPVAKKLLVSEGRIEQDLGIGEVEAKIGLLRSNTVPVAFPDSSVIQVTYFAEASAEAVRVLKLLLDQYMVQHEVVYTGSTKLLTFYEQERDRVGAQLRTAEESLKKWQEANNVVSVDEQITRWITTLSDRERGLQQTEADLAVGRENVRDPLIAKLKGDLVSAEVALQDVLQRYTESDRRVQERREQVALIKKELRTAEKGFLNSLTSQRDTLRTQVREASAALAGMREKKIEFNRLSRMVELNRDAFMLYGKKVEEARMAAKLDKEQLSNVAVIEEPYAPYVTDMNKRIGVTLLAAIVGLSLGVAIAFGFDFFNNSLRTEDDVEYYLGAPVLASIPDFKDRPLALETNHP